VLGFELFLCCRQQVGELACVVIEFKMKSIGSQYVISLLYTLRDLLRKKNDVLLEKLIIQYKIKPVNTRVNFDKVNYQKNSSLCIFFFQPVC